MAASINSNSLLWAIKASKYTRQWQIDICQY